MKDNETALDPQAAHRRHRRLVRLGQVLMAAGAGVAIWHWILHLAPSGEQPSLTLDIYAGYPTGAAQIMIGAILAGRAETKKKR
ncbi:hypothetical protein [uncultured Arthrobacter sp.]|uniref:hypothetical protein n=1 Tax=uncultured Arthrobacter sp. TaxID=114050 RepID=UPI0032179425